MKIQCKWCKLWFIVCFVWIMALWCIVMWVKWTMRRRRRNWGLTSLPAVPLIESLYCAISSPDIRKALHMSSSRTAAEWRTQSSWTTRPSRAGSWRSCPSATTNPYSGDAAGVVEAGRRTVAGGTLAGEGLSPGVGGAGEDHQCTEGGVPHTAVGSLVGEGVEEATSRPTTSLVRVYQ